MPEEMKGMIDDFLTENLSAELQEQPRSSGLDITSLVSEWFNPRQDIMRHLIVIQLIASLIVTAFLIITEGQTMTPTEGMFSIIFFLFLAAMSVAMYARL
jgi:hypothetical protein